MKKYIFLAVAAVTLLFVGCQKNELHPSEPSGFELIANIAKTKTTLSEDFKVDWEEGDVLYMVTSDGTWGKPYKEDEDAASIAEFVYESGKFSTTSLIDPNTYTFKAMYATEAQKSFHRGASSTHKLNATQSQNCADPTAEVKKNDALVGTFEAKVPMTKPAEVNMQHLYTLMRVDIKNATGASVEVKSFEMTAAGADLAAIFNVVAFDTPSLTTKQDASETITVNLAGGTVDNDASLPVYFVMAPLTNYTGDVTFKVTDSENKTYTKTVTLSGKTFAAGHYNTTPYTIGEADAVEPEPEGVKTATISFASTAQRTSYSTELQVWENEGVTFTNSKGSSTSNVGDYSNPARFYKSTNISVTAPGNITMLEFDCTGLESKYVTPFTDLGGVSNNGIVKISLDGTSSTVSYTSLSAQARAKSLTVTYVIADPTAPSITAGNVTDVSARGFEAAELTYEIANLEYSDLTVTCDGTVVTSASKGEGGVINYVVSVNSTTSARDGSITISNGTLVKEVKVSQLAPVFTVSRDAVELGATKDSKTTVTVTSDFDWELSKEGAGYTVTPDSYTWDEDGKETVAIQATASRTEEGVANLGTITLVNSTTGQKLTIKVTQATSFVAEGGGNEETATLSFANKAQRTTFTSSQQIWEQNGIKLINNKASSTNAVADYANPARFYAGSNLEVTAPGAISTIVFDANSASYATAMKNSIGTVSGATVTVSSDKVTVTFTSPVESFAVAKFTAQVRMDSVTVTYQN